MGGKEKVDRGDERLGDVWRRMSAAIDDLCDVLDESIAIQREASNNGARNSRNGRNKEA